MGASIRYAKYRRPPCRHSRSSRPGAMATWSADVDTVTRKSIQSASRDTKLRWQGPRVVDGVDAGTLAEPAALALPLVRQLALRVVADARQVVVVEEGAVLHHG